MKTVTVVPHRDAEAGWWAESPDVPGYTAADPDLQELRRLVTEGLEFFLDEPVRVDERLAGGAHLPVELRGSAVLMSSMGSAVARLVSDTSTLSTWRAYGPTRTCGVPTPA